MLTRRRLALLAPAGLLAVGLVAATAVYATRSDAPSPIGGAFTLHDGDGHTVTEADLLGHYTLVYFGYTHCPDACPTALQDMANALDLLGPRKAGVRILFISVDPDRDTPAVVKDYVTNFDAPITALSGSPEEVARAARAYRVYYARHDTSDGGYEMDHSSIIYLMDREGRFVANFTHQTAPDQIAAKLRSFV